MIKRNINQQNNKNDLNVTWRGVQYTLSPENIRSQVVENARLAQQKRIHSEQMKKMYDIFGSGKPKKELSSKLKTKETPTKFSDKDSEEKEGAHELEILQSSQRSTISSKGLSKTHESLNLDHSGKRKLSISSIIQSVDIRLRPKKLLSPVNDLYIAFEQNKPSMYFGIRKFKSFETEEKDAKQASRKSTQNELLANSKIQGTEGKDNNLKRLSMAMRKLSYQPSALIAVDELKEKYVELDKTTANQSKKGSSINDVLEIVNKLVKESIIEMDRLKSISGYQDIRLPDDFDKVDRNRILYLYINKYYRIKEPLRQQQVNDVTETDFEKEVMTNCVINHKILNKLMNKHSFYSHRQQITLAEIDGNLNANADDKIEKSFSEVVKNRKEMDHETYLKLFKKSQNILDEICTDIKEFNGFYLPLIETWFTSITTFKELLLEIDVEKIRKYVHNLSHTLTVHRNHPGSISRMLLLQFIKTGEVNSVVLNELVNNAENWLDQVLKTFLSKYQSIRLEAFIVLAYLFSKQIYVNALHSAIFHDVIYDVISTLLRCFDLKSEDYEMYYSLIGVIFHYAPCQSLLESIMDRAPYSLHIEVVSKWPRFIYLAFRYWPSSTFNTSVMYLKRVIETLENHYLRESLSKKCLKEAITCISRRFNVNSTLFTTWPTITNDFPD